MRNSGNEKIPRKVFSRDGACQKLVFLHSLLLCNWHVVDEGMWICRRGDFIRWWWWYRNCVELENFYLTVVFLLWNLIQTTHWKNVILNKKIIKWIICWILDFITWLCVLEEFLKNLDSYPDFSNESILMMFLLKDSFICNTHIVIKQKKKRVK